MAKYRAIFDEKGKAYEFTNGELSWVRPDLVASGQGVVCSQRSHAVCGDIPDFVSPIDGTVVSGRAGLREHCLKHDVVPNEELKGLPPKTMNQQYQLSPEQREATRRTMHQIISDRHHRHFK